MRRNHRSATEIHMIWAIDLDTLHRHRQYLDSIDDIACDVSAPESGALLTQQLASEAKHGVLGNEFDAPLWADDSTVERGDTLAELCLDAERYDQFQNAIDQRFADQRDFALSPLVTITVGIHQPLKQG